MDELYDVIKEQVEKIITEVKKANEDKILTLSEVWFLSQETITSFVAIANKLNTGGKDKKTVVMQAAERLYDEVIAPIDIKAIPNIIEPSFDRLGKNLFLELVSGSVDYIVKTVNQNK